MHLVIAKSPVNDKIYIRAYRTREQLCRWLKREDLEPINGDASYADIKPYANVNYTGAAFTSTGVYVAKIGAEHDVYRIPDEEVNS